jgi:hypothetical protein
MTMLVYLDDFRKTRAETVKNNVAELKNGTYGDDVMNASRNSAVLCAFSAPSQQSQHAFSPEIPDDFAAVDVDALMSRIYALASQV